MRPYSRGPRPEGKRQGAPISKVEGLTVHDETVGAAPAGTGVPATLKRYAGLAYAVVAFVLAIAFWPVFIFFIGNVPRIEMPLMDPSVSAATTVLHTWQALAIDVALIAAFALHHSFLARPAVKRVWGRYVAEPFRRATFTHIANVFAFALILLWQPIPIVMWQFDHHSALLRFLIVPLWQLGWVLLLLGAMSFKLTALFGLRQVWFWFKGRPYEPVDITKNRSYRLARHPEFLGVFLLIWVTADMTVGHFLLAASLTVYSFIALGMRERELARQIGPSQVSYQAEVPMLGPRWAVATCLALWLAISAVSVLHTYDQRRADAQVRADLIDLKQALLAYRRQTGAMPAHLYNPTLPPPDDIIQKSCEHPDFNNHYDAMMAEMTGMGLLEAPLAHADRRSKDLGYCYLVYRRGDGKDAWVLWASLGSAALSNTGEPNTCRPFKSAVEQTGFCETDRASKDYCLCLE